MYVILYLPFFKPNVIQLQYFNQYNYNYLAEHEDVFRKNNTCNIDDPKKMLVHVANFEAADNWIYFVNIKLACR